MEGTIYGWTSWSQCWPTVQLGPIYEVIDMQSGVRVDVFDAYSTVDGQNDDNEGTRYITNVLGVTVGKTYKVKVYGYGHESYAGLCFWADLDLKRLEELPPQPDDYLVGGLRIASIKFKDDDGSVLLSNSYDYTQSSLLYNPKFLYRQSYDADQPIFGLSAYFFLMDFEPAEDYFNNHRSGEFYLLTTDDPYTLDFSGSHISYGRVTEKAGEGQTVYTFYPPQTYQQFNGYTNYNNIPVRPVTQSPYAGKLVVKEIFDELGNLKQKDKYSYSIQLSNIETPAFAVAKPGTYQGVGFVHYNLRPESLHLTSQVSTQYEANKEISKDTKYYYESSAHSQVTRMETEKSDGETKKEVYTYPQDVSNPTSSESELIAQNRVNEVIKTESLVNDAPLSVSKINYKTSNGLVLPDFVEIAYGGEDPVVEITFSRYDDLGNPLEYKGKDGIPGSYIWGYNHTLPVAKIVNATFSEIEAISGFGAKFHAGAGGLSQSQENSLRSVLQNAQIITYSYYPLIGMASQTDSNGRTIYYYYDNLGRLKSIKDHDQKVLKAYQYHYK
ncbi:hypothetical protein LVD17_21005 [Fulvivirga ulvae]|uniref:hypothetical protein n=1 Tax=Fulvivirga ulvae TaxID=2904245 RepID=UPI001F165316|nr:hypothetical protein [Fulvivirga ulvae]UII30776.1 hypothetical protein LVD17_21005 [Fulvivirga ulvae]